MERGKNLEGMGAMLLPAIKKQECKIASLLLIYLPNGYLGDSGYLQEELDGKKRQLFKKLMRYQEGERVCLKVKSGKSGKREEKKFVIYLREMMEEKEDLLCEERRGEEGRI